MISATKIKEIYEAACGYTLYNDYGSVTEAIRKKNEIVYSVCGLFKMQPVQLTAIRAPFIGVASANIEIIAPTHMTEEVRTKLNTAVAAALNGVTVSLPDEEEREKTYSVSFTVQTCTVGEKADIGAWYGECVTLYQTISFVIIEEGVSSYDTVLKIDSMTVPLLSLSETKVHTTSVYPSATAIGHTASEQEAYGIDFATPYVKSELCKLFHEAVNGCTGNTAHCVEITKNGVANAYIMAISAAADSVQPPSNIGFNISLTEVSPTIARFNGRWRRYTHTGDVITQETTLSKLTPRLTDTAEIIFWGDGSFDYYKNVNTAPYHVYTDGKETHDIMCYTPYPAGHMREIEYGDDLLGKEIIASVPGGRVTAWAMLEEAKAISGSYDNVAMLLGAFDNDDGLYCDGTRIYLRKPGGGRIYIDTDEYGSYWLSDGQRFICTVNGPLSYLSNGTLCTFLVSLDDVPEEVVK